MAGPLPYGWEERYDENYKRHYYVNASTKTTTWYDPRKSQGLHSQPPSVHTNHSQAMLNTALTGNPNGDPLLTGLGNAAIAAFANQGRGRANPNAGSVNPSAAQYQAHMAQYQKYLQQYGAFNPPANTFGGFDFNQLNNGQFTDPAIGADTSGIDFSTMFGTDFSNMGGMDSSVIDI
ncbi:3639_t:CDS:2 [Ambispora gerdemannii]|uniref:3639_t:CDS:1 n=1 Tax=Ambispora gerdemannii TaxID=144530 RepID=A0A9N9FQV2_9GLOM|nr:3639_t:CDS:2 [Ambispora gerdemannii]